jgi:hypothetical protein
LEPKERELIDPSLGLEEAFDPRAFLAGELVIVDRRAAKVDSFFADSYFFIGSGFFSEAFVGFPVA